MKKIFLILTIIMLLSLFILFLKNMVNNKDRYLLENVNYKNKEIICVAENKENKIIFYFLDGGSLSSDSVVGVYKVKNIEKVIFLVYPCNSIKYEWIDKNIISISWQDRHEFKEKKVVLNVTKDTFDWRKEL
ncbi:MAG: DUF5412 family protein [Eubacteriales bacterium]